MATNLCLVPNDDGDERCEGYCELEEASDIGTPCETCYFSPCEHGRDAGCQEPCACGHVCCEHWGISPKTGEIYRGCMGPDGEDSKSCACEAFNAGTPRTSGEGP